MPRTFLGKKVLLLGSGGLKIGQAGEFDYSGSQAIKALKQEGIEVVLINPNIATVQTDENLADKVYFLPLEFFFVQKIIEKENPDGILLGFGGQTALNLGLELEEKGVLEQHNIVVLGTGISNVLIAEDREKFRSLLIENNIDTPPSTIAYSEEEAIKKASSLSFPLMVRTGFSLGGLGSGKIENLAQLKLRLKEVFVFSKQVLLEEYLLGWKEIEFEVVRDPMDHALAICGMENLDPMGIHTGESIVVAPIQTLSDEDYQSLRSIALKVAKLLNVVGECNVQFAFNPKNGSYRVIEMNPRLSRSSALASKATGYPLAYVAAKLSLGYNLFEIQNSVTKKTTAYFEPALDYIAIKIPRWDMSKLKSSDRKLGSEMKSVGEVMGIGRSFPEALQKAIRMLNIGSSGIEDCPEFFKNLEGELKNPTENRIFALYKFLQKTENLDLAFEFTNVDPWFLYQILSIAKLENTIKKEPISKELLLEAKRFGFSDESLSKIYNKEFFSIRNQRKKWGIVPYIKQIDTLAGEFDAKTNYLYLTYWGVSHDIEPPKIPPVVILGSGPYCIGSSVEFDWCAVNASRELRKHNQSVVIINSNPETVSTDYDESDKLYFEELTKERVLDILDFENPKGVIVSLGGQIPNNLAMTISKENFPLIGTSAEDIDKAENRKSFSSLLKRLNIDQPKWVSVESLDSVRSFIDKVGYPIMIRPSYVLSGSAMSVAFNNRELFSFLEKAQIISKDHPIVLSKFIEDAKELEMDGIALNGKVVIETISEHIEPAGVHSGDATILLPPQKLYVETVRHAKKYSSEIVKALNITGPFNIQFMAKENRLYIIECNIRASRSFPFVSKCIGHNLIKIAVECFLKTYQHEVYETLNLPCYGVKSPQFSYQRMKGVNPVSTVEMTSTGEVASLSEDFLEAFYFSWMSAGQKILGKNLLLFVEEEKQYKKFLPFLKGLEKKGWEFYGIGQTHDFLVNSGMGSVYIHDVSNQVFPNVFSLARDSKFDLMINIPSSPFALRDKGYEIRRLMVDYNIPLVTNFQLAITLMQSILYVDLKNLNPKSYCEHFSYKNATYQKENFYDKSILPA